MAHKEIGLYLDISQTTLRKYFDLYLSGGVVALKQLHYQGKTNHLLQQKEVIVAAMEANPPSTLKQAQAIIKEGTGLEPLIAQAQKQQLHLFFMDAAHFVMLPFLGYVYSLLVRYLKRASGRKRFNVLGALHAVSHELVTLTSHETINVVLPGAWQSNTDNRQEESKRGCSHRLSRPPEASQ